MNTPCVVHPGWRDKDGYVRAKVAGGRRVFVHRFAWESAHGSIPPGMVVCHHCDNPPCVNPDHLFLGTNAENLEDMTRKGRRTRGDTHGMSRLSEADIPVIRSLRAAGVALSVVAARYGVSITTISRVATGKTWRHVA